jgi:hypothetical protein
METTILQEPIVSFEEQIVIHHIHRVYKYIKIESGITANFNIFFNGVLKPAFSVERAAHDAVIYHCYKTLDKTISVKYIITMFQISTEQMLDIIWCHSLKMESKDIYYRTFSRKLSKNDTIAFPMSVQVDVPEHKLSPEKYVQLVADIVFEEIYEKTNILKKEIIEKSRKYDIVKCRTVLFNVIIQAAPNVRLKNICDCIHIDHSMVSFYRHKHKDNLEQSFKEFVSPKVIEYMKLYNYIVERINQKLKKKLV